MSGELLTILSLFVVVFGGVICVVANMFIGAYRDTVNKTNMVIVQQRDTIDRLLNTQDSRAKNFDRTLYYLVDTQKRERDEHQTRQMELVDKYQAMIEKQQQQYVVVFAAPPAQKQPQHLDDLYGQVQEVLNEFQEGAQPDPHDTKDWTDDLFPDARDEPRVASVKPGDSIIPGQGNWDEMMREGRIVQNGGVEGGEDETVGNVGYE